ncbi:MAG: helix-turn-helix domain-containing protein [Oligoflexus sp.]|jgi:curved DNA-binding protein CbpA
MIEQLGTESNAMRNTQPSPHQGPSLYELLDVSTQATRLQIREAYIRLKATYASGSQALYSLVSDEEARETLEKIEEAYRVLDDEMLRKDYDDSLGLGRSLGADVFQGEPTRPHKRATLGGETGALINYPSESAGGSEPWMEESIEAKPVLRRMTSLTKIKKFATRAFDRDIKALREPILARPQAFDGAALTQLREIEQVQQSEIQERTKIAIEYIKALENNDFPKLPSLVYVRGFLKIYLQYLGLQDQEAKPLIEAYSEKYNLWREKNRPHAP